MTARSATAVIVVATTVNLTGEEGTVFYGPFLPHVGSATTSFLGRLESELEESGEYSSWEISIESVVMGEGESDCVVRATR